MLEENRGIIDEGTWQIVYSFFHPEENVYHSGSICGILGSLLGEHSMPIGISGGSLPDSSNFYSGRPAYLVWTADENAEEKAYWRAQIMVASGTGFNDSIVVSITDAQGECIDSAILILLSSTLRVTNGKAYYCLADFQEHLSNTDVALIFPDGRRVPGVLKLGDIIL